MWGVGSLHLAWPQVPWLLLAAFLLTGTVQVTLGQDHMRVSSHEARAGHGTAGGSLESWRLYHQVGCRCPTSMELLRGLLALTAHPFPDRCPCAPTS